MPAQALREDARSFDRRCVVQVTDGDERTDGERPRPALARRIMLGIADDLDDCEDRLPHRRVEDRRLATLDRRPLGRGMRADCRRIDAGAKRPVATASD
jgi:hypothetical protein